MRERLSPYGEYRYESWSFRLVLELPRYAPGIGLADGALDRLRRICRLGKIETITLQNDDGSVKDALQDDPSGLFNYYSRPVENRKSKGSNTVIQLNTAAVASDIYNKRESLQSSLAWSSRIDNALRRGLIAESVYNLTEKINPIDVYLYPFIIYSLASKPLIVPCQRSIVSGIFV